MSAYTDLQRELASGWNTWNTRSMTSHVLLPEGFAVNLGVQHYGNGRYLKEPLLGRLETGAEVVTAGPRSYDGAYTDLTIEWAGVKLRVESATDGDDLLLLVTPMSEHLRAPLIVAESGMLWNREGRLSREGDVLVAECPGRTVRVYATAQTVYDPYVAAQTPYLAVPMTQVVGFCTGHARTVEEIAARIADARTRWLASVERFGDMAECYTAIQTCLAWDTIYEPQGDRVVSPVSRVWNVDRGRGGFVLFCWDTYFAAIMAGIDNKAIAYANAVEITREIRDLGFVPNNAQATGRKSCDRSQPPVGSITILDLYRQYGDRWLLEETFDDLLTWNCFWIQRRLDASSGLLCWGSHPFTPRAGDPLEVEQPNTWLGAILETGLDNSPLYDDVPFDPETHLMPLADVGLNGLYVADCRALAEMADALGRPEAEELRARADQFAARLQTLWDDASGIYLNRRTDTGESSHKLAPTNFYPMLGCVPTQAQAERMVREHLLNPDEFATPWPLPSIAKRDPAYPEQEYWRGRVWGPMNWLVYLGLCQYDLPEARAWLAARSEALFLKEWREHGHVHENYNAETGEGDDVTSSDRFYHWGGLLGLIALRERG